MRRGLCRRVGITLALALCALAAHAVFAAPSPAQASQAAGSTPALAGSSDPIAVAAAEALLTLRSDDPGYPERLAVLVPLVAERSHVSADRLTAAWSLAPRGRMVVLLSALTQVGVPYRARRATAGVGFDCSGLTSWAWRQVGRWLPHQSRSQIRRIARTSVRTLLPGDIVYYPGHAMLALGVGAASVHAPYPGRSVEVIPASSRWLRSARFGTPDGRRLLAGT